MRIKIICILAFILLVGAFGCSEGNDPAVPVIDQTSQTVSGHCIWAAVDFYWDGASDELKVLPNRVVAKHYNVTPFLLPGYVTLKILDWDIANKVLTIEATLENPLPLDGYDVRGILTNMVDARLLNPDDYTKIFDLNDPQVANPFRAYAKDDPTRKFYGNYALPDQYIKSEIFEIYVPSGIFASFIVTAAFPDNAHEPYDIVSIEQEGLLYEDGGSLVVTVNVLDWQGITAYEVVIEDNPVTGGDVLLTKIDDTEWQATITNSGGALGGDYELWVAAWDQVAPHALYNKFTVRVELPQPLWTDPILVAGEQGVDEILPRLVLRENDYWIIYTDGTDALARSSGDGGYTWSEAEIIGNYEGIDTIHAVLGGDNGVYVQYQKSSTKYTYLSVYEGGSWATPVSTSYMGMTVSPFSCDLGIGADGYLYDMTTGSWSALGLRSDSPFDITYWSSDPIGTFYNAVYSINDGFVQQASTPKFFYVHDDTQLDYAWYDGGWDKAPAMTGDDALIEPAIAPESDGPYHGVMAANRGGSYDVEYFRFDSWPPTTPYTVALATGLIDEPVFHSISADGDAVSVLFDADGDVLYVESADGGDTFGSPEKLGEGSCAYSHVRRDAFAGGVIAAYAEEEGGDYNIYVRLQN